MSRPCVGRAAAVADYVRRAADVAGYDRRMRHTHFFISPILVDRLSSNLLCGVSSKYVIVCTSQSHVTLSAHAHFFIYPTLLDRLSSNLLCGVYSKYLIACRSQSRVTLSAHAQYAFFHISHTNEPIELKLAVRSL